MKNKKERILVTGGTGFVGSYIIRTLLKKGYKDIISTKRRSSRLDLIADIKDDIKLVDTDINDLQAMEELIDKVDYVIHAAALVSFNPRDYESLMKTNVEGTENLVNLCIESDVKKLVYISSVAALGRSKKSALINEQSKWASSALNTNYAISKYLAEQHVWRGQNEGLNTVIVNPSLILGAGYWDKGSCSLFKQVYKGVPMYPPGKNGVVDVRDVAELSVILMQNEITNERYICNGANIGYKELFQSMAAKMNVRSPQKALNKWMGSLVWRLFWVKSIFDGKRASITRESIKTSFNTFSYDNSKSLEKFDFEYREIENTLSDTCRAYLNSLPSGKDHAFLS